ncbi:hypothetical protein HX827_01680 [Marine Group I thaumarchaeote]|uniref:Uncharacterized protein n=1 Tax=Marine Group I thaumarchaeote TaxID=2511932 RepID=A0A7K4NSX2_9ARCH|nr:hypothetical protein [Marine Group I thaumarchaeote]
MKKTLLIFLGVLFLFFNVNEAFGHQLIFSDGMNTKIDNSLYIPDPQISWAMYGEVKNNVLFYKFDADQKEPLYASIVIPALEGLEEFHPSLAIISERQNIGLISLQVDENNTDLPFELPEKFSAIVFDYYDNFPGRVFYEPFTQVNYWERQEIRIHHINPGTYYLAVFNTSENGKFTLAVGEIEDFRNANFFDSFVRAWFETKIFFEDYLTAFVAIVITAAIFSGIGYGIFRAVKRVIR